MALTNRKKKLNKRNQLFVTKNITKKMRRNECVGIP